MAACTVTARQLIPLGQVSVEIIRGTAAANQDTVSTQFIQNVIGALCFSLETLNGLFDGVAPEQVTSGAGDFKILTTQNNMDFALLVFGY